MPKTVIMIDQDGVVFDRNYQTNNDISDTIKAMQDRYLLVPNSDTPISRLKNNFKSALGYDPEVIIGEYGAIVEHFGREYKVNEVGHLVNYLEGLANGMRGLVDFEFEVGDAASWIKEGRKFLPNTKYMLIDGWRQCSACFYLRRTDRNGIAQIDERWFDQGKRVFEEVFCQNGDLEDFDYNPKYGIAIAHALGSSKQLGYVFLRRRLDIGRVYMIGDSDSDNIAESEVIHCSVGNGQQSYKDICQFVAENEYTAGLKECLKWIDSQVI